LGKCHKYDLQEEVEIKECAGKNRDPDADCGCLTGYEESGQTPDCFLKCENGTGLRDNNYKCCPDGYTIDSYGNCVSGDICDLYSESYSYESCTEDEEGKDWCKSVDITFTFAVSSTGRLTSPVDLIANWILEVEIFLNLLIIHVVLIRTILHLIWQILLGK